MRVKVPICGFKSSNCWVVILFTCLFVCTETLLCDQSAKISKLLNLTISDFEHEASIQKSRLDSIKLETSENLEVLDDSIPTIEIDF